MKKLDHPNVVKLVEVVDDPEEVHPDAEDNHWDHSLRIEKILHNILFEQLEKLMMLMIVAKMLSSLSRWTIQKRSVLALRIWNHNCRN